MGPTAEAAPRVNYSTFVTNTCQSRGGFVTKPNQEVVTESPQPWEHLDATGFSGSGRGLISGQAGQQRTEHRGLKQQHAQALLTVLLRGMCALRNVDFQLQERSAALGAPQQWKTFPLEENPVPHTHRVLPQEGNAAQSSLGSAQSQQLQNPKISCRHPQVINVFFNKALKVCF